MKMLESLERIDRIDNLIRRKATGTPKSLATKLGISERSVRRLIEMMKNMGAPIFYCISRQCYCYEEEVEFRFGFYCKDGDVEQLYGGTGNISDVFSVFFGQRSDFGRKVG